MENYINILWIYLAAVNIALFVLMGVDKYKSIKGAWRIPEATLFLFAIIGGGLGGTFGMYSFRHKTQHMKFAVGFPLITIVQWALIVWLLKGI